MSEIAVFASYGPNSLYSGLTICMTEESVESWRAVLAYPDGDVWVYAVVAGVEKTELAAFLPFILPYLVLPFTL